MSESKLKKNSYFQHVSHASYKDRDRFCITSVCVASTGGDWAVPSHTLAQEILAENKGSLWEIKSWSRITVASKAFSLCKRKQDTEWTKLNYGLKKNNNILFGSMTILMLIFPYLSLKLDISVGQIELSGKQYYGRRRGGDDDTCCSVMAQNCGVAKFQYKIMRTGCVAKDQTQCPLSRTIPNVVHYSSKTTLWAFGLAIFNEPYVERVQQLCFQYGPANELNRSLYAE